ncbi:FAD-binding oxidoreductase [uncultured Williamsia sp.]|uniref:FAD-binding oxidoreductase n=1 Tax=uncultured Williamsia sp. TaxID=259311 RepID=UPI0026250D33|nr:FAD-binding oxidoreductase [uncultured Williamsia sp.]
MTTAIPAGFAGRLDTRTSEREAFLRDETGLPGRTPRGVIRARSADDVVACVRWAGTAGIPVIPVGARTSLEGHLLARGDEVMLDVSSMDDIVSIDPADFVAVVQPGVTRKQLAAALVPHGLQFPVDPGADATLGGMAATNASGTTTFRYGGMRRNVLALTAVTADGEIHRFGRAVAKSSSGYDLKDLLIGSAGTLAAITELTLRLHPVPEAQGSARLSFPDVAAAVAAATDLIGSAVPVSRLEFVDSASIAALNRFCGDGLPPGPALFIDVEATSAAAMAEVLDDVDAIARVHGVVSVGRAQTATERTALWDNRHRLFPAIKAAHPGHQFLVTDTAVPYSAIAGAVDHAHRTAAELGLRVTTAGHVGDGNVHVVVPYSGGTLPRALAFSDAMVEYALSVGGTASGEHGIGLAKKKYLAAEHGSACDVMAAVKQALDPRNLFNPGKILDP